MSLESAPRQAASVGVGHLGAAEFCSSGQSVSSRRRSHEVLDDVGREYVKDPLTAMMISEEDTYEQFILDLFKSGMLEFTCRCLLVTTCSLPRATLRSGVFRFIFIHKALTPVGWWWIIELLQTCQAMASECMKSLMLLIAYSKLSVGWLI